MKIPGPRLSPKQQGIMDCIRSFLDEKGYPPTVRDIQRGCDISSTSVVDYNLNILERLGILRRDPEVSRGIELLEGRPRQSVPVPLLGSIAAGQPIPVPSSDTWRQTELDMVDVAPDMVKGSEKVIGAASPRKLSPRLSIFSNTSCTTSHASASRPSSSRARRWIAGANCV